MNELQHLHPKIIEVIGNSNELNPNLETKNQREKENE